MTPAFPRECLLISATSFLSYLAVIFQCLHSVLSHLPFWASFAFQKVVIVHSLEWLLTREAWNFVVASLKQLFSCVLTATVFLIFTDLSLNPWESLLSSVYLLDFYEVWVRKEVKVKDGSGCLVCTLCVNKPSYELNSFFFRQHQRVPSSKEPYQVPISRGSLSQLLLWFLSTIII